MVRLEQFEIHSDDVSEVLDDEGLESRVRLSYHVVVSAFVFPSVCAVEHGVVVEHVVRGVEDSVAGVQVFVGV